ACATWAYPLFWYSHLESLDVWPSYISTKINVPNLILVPFVVFLWVMPLIRKATAVIDLKTHETIGHGKRIGGFYIWCLLSFMLESKYSTDNGGEYVNNTLASFFRAQGIIHKMTTSFTP
ncbi:hypothetical protein Prudu_361S000200, partial [Prunus dulcis]